MRNIQRKLLTKQSRNSHFKICSGEWKNLHIELFADAAHANIEENNLTKSDMGFYIALSNKNGEVNTLHWKTKVIDKVAESGKTAETIAL